METVPGTVDQQAAQRSSQGAAGHFQEATRHSRKYNSNNVNIGSSDLHQDESDPLNIPDAYATNISVPPSSMERQLDQDLASDPMAQAGRYDQNGFLMAHTNNDYAAGPGVEATKEAELAAGFEDQLLHGPGKLEYNNQLDISSIRLANSDQQQKFGASMNQ